MSKKATKRSIWVYAHWQEFKAPVLMGLLQAELLRGKEIFSFEYDEDWLKSKFAQQLDPDLGLYSGPHYLNNEKPNFGLFLDSSPDRWGRILMRRREAANARMEKRTENTLFETDYLLGVFDGHRMGGLRFKLDESGLFLNDNKEMAVPPFTSLRELEQISLRLEDEDAIHDPEYINWLEILMAPGSSLGGARPKASVMGPDNHLYIAKFPSKNDQTDVGGWEMVTYQLAKGAGLNMAESQVKKYAGKHHTFITKRFDRTNTGERIHFSSAMTMLGYIDGQGYQEGISYLELVDFISNHGVNIESDLEELWRRIVFNISVSNTDDHLRNHGFILTPRGWSLSPAFDLNPVSTGTGLSLNISENDNSLNIDLAMEVHPYFRLKQKRALQIILEVKNQVKEWKKVARQMGISRNEQELKASAFRY